MKKLRLLTILILTFSFLAFTIQPASAFPPLPSSFKGTVKVDGANVNGSTVVTARINGVQYASTTVSTYLGDTVYSLDVKGDESDTPGIIEGGVEGDIVVFFIGGIQAAQTGTWHSGTNVTLNLTGFSNRAPTDISISNSSVAENATANTVVGALSSTDPDAGNTFTYSLVDTGTYPDNASFNISGSSLRTSVVFNFETKSSYSIRVRTTDQGALTFDKTFTINITNVNEAPAITESSPQTVNMSVNGVPNAFSLTLHATDVDSATLNWSISSAALHGTATASGTGNSKSIGYTSNVDYIGSDSFGVQVSDGSLTASLTVNVNISAVTYTISGNAGVSGATISFTGGSSVSADGAGNFIITVPYGWTGTITPTLSGYFFTPANLSFTNVQANQTGANFTATVMVYQEITLIPGWNLVSFYIRPASTNIADVLLSVEGNYDLVYAWDATGAHSGSGNWMKYDNVPASTDTLLTLNETMGFWIHMTESHILRVGGSLPTTSAISLDDNASGWNLVGYPSSVNRDLPEVFGEHGVGTNFSLVYFYNGVDPINPWKLFDRIGPVYVNDMTVMTNSWGYWVKVSADCTWSVAYAAP